MLAFATCAALPLRGARATPARCTRRFAVRASASEKMLHVVYRVGDMTRTGTFLTALGMQLLRDRDVPEEKYANAFYGYGTESRGQHFAVELTYNYGVNGYDVGNALHYFGVAVADKDAVLAKLASSGFAHQPGTDLVVDPTGYGFKVMQGVRKDPMCAVAFNVSDLDKSLKFYENIGMQVIAAESAHASVGYGDEASTTVLHLTQRDGAKPMVMGDGYGQIAVSTPSVYDIAERMRGAGVNITRDPGPVPGIGTKITAVRDPDGFKVVFVDETDFEAELV